MKIKKLTEIYQSRFESYGEEITRNHFKGEMNHDSGKLFHMFFLTMVVWLPYIPYDLKIHQFPYFAVGIRILFSVISAFLILLKLTKRFRYRPDILLIALITSLYFLTAVITGTAGNIAPGYIGGMAFVMLLPVFAPYPMTVKYILPVLTVTVFFAAGFATGLDFSDLSVRYSINDLFASFFISILLSRSLQESRLSSWKQRQELKEVIANNKEHTETIYKLANEAEASARSKSDFLAKMSHEIRTPMNAITGMAELALREELTPVAYEHILTIKHAGANLISIINDILDFSKIESGKLEIIPTDYKFSSLVNDVISIIRMRVVDSELRFVVNIDRNIPDALYGDEIRLRQILLNILNNSVKYTTEGYVSLTVIGEADEEDADKVVLYIEVTDSGRGIKQEDLENLFIDFMQFDKAENKGVEGTGLGLAITHRLVKAMGGDISVMSEYGRGSTFTTTLPQKIRNHAKLAAVENPKEKRALIYELREIYANSIVCTIDNLDVNCTLVSDNATFEKEISSGLYPFVFIASPLYAQVKDIVKNFPDVAIILLTGFGEAAADKNLRNLAMPVHSISVANVLNGEEDSFSYREIGETDVRFIAPDASVLIVDDVKTNLNVAEGLLLPYKMRVTLRLSGKEALEAVTANKYDLIFMDHMMPEMDGIETVARIRAFNSNDPYYKDVPIIALTANAIMGNKDMFLENGFNGFLSKPIDTVKLNSMLEKWIQKEKQLPNDNKITREENIELEIKGVNSRKGLKMTGGKIETYKRILRTFVREGYEKLTQIKDNSNNLKLYITYVHALKSASASIGANELSEMAQDLETAGNNEDLSFIKENNAALMSELETLLVNINNALEEATPENSELSLLNASLGKLSEALKSADAATIKEAVRAVKPFINSDMAGEAVMDILQSVMAKEYNEADEMINKLLREGINETH